jgi:flagellin-like hook-associated protein FlgL
VQNVKERTQFNGGTGSVFGTTNTLSTGTGTVSEIQIADLSLGNVGTIGEPPIPTEVTMTVGAPGTGFEYQSQRGSAVQISNLPVSASGYDGGLSYLEITASDYFSLPNISTQIISAGERVYLDGVDTGFTVSQAYSYDAGNSNMIYGVVFFGAPDNGGAGSAADFIAALQSQNFTGKTVTFSGPGAKWDAIKSTSNGGVGVEGDLVLNNPIPDLAIGSVLADQFGRYIGTVNGIDTNDPRNITFGDRGNWIGPGSGIQVMAGISRAVGYLSGGTPGSYTFGVNGTIDPALTSGSVITSLDGEYLGTVTDISGNTLTVNNSSNLGLNNQDVVSWYELDPDFEFLFSAAPTRPEFQMSVEMTGSSEVRAGMKVFKNGVDTGLTVAFAHYVPSPPGIDNYDSLGNTTDCYDIKTTAPDGSPALRTLINSGDEITFSGGVSSPSAQGSYTYNPSNAYDQQTLTLSAPITGLAIGNAIADSSGHHIGIVRAIDGAGTGITIDRANNDGYEVPDGGWTNNNIHVMTSTATLISNGFTNTDNTSTFDIAVANPSIVSGSVLTDKYGNYIGTVQSVNDTHITLTEPINYDVFMAMDAIIQIASPSDAPVVTENDPHSLNLVDDSGANAAADGKIANDAYFDGSGNVLSLEGSDVANLSTSVVQDAIGINATNRSDLGTWLNRLEYSVDNMQTLSTNLADGISRIVDTDYAAETSNLTRTQIMQQAATSMLAQANQMPNVILTLLK